MDVVKEFGNPDELLNALDLVLLKLKEPWSHSQNVPENCSIVGADNNLIRTTRKGLVSGRKVLTKLAYTGALFASCVPFESSLRFSKIAANVLRRADTLVLVHSRDRLCDIVTNFVGISVLVLYHDLKFHCCVRNWQTTGPVSKIRRIAGCSPAMGMQCLFLTSGTLARISNRCPQLAEVQASVDEAFTVTDPGADMTQYCSLDMSKAKSLILGKRVVHVDGSLSIDNHAHCSMVAHVLRVNPRLESLELNTNSVESVLMLTGFASLRKLSIVLVDPETGLLPSFDVYILQLLRKFALQELALANFDNVRLSTIAELCRDSLTSLSLTGCKIVDEGIAREAFLQLEELKVEMYITKGTFRSLLAASPNLKCLQLKCKYTCAMLLHDLAPESCLENVVSLTLGMSLSFSQAGIDERNLRKLVEKLPSLRFLATDSVDVRTFFEEEVPHVKVSWYTCRTCAQAAPKMEKDLMAYWGVLTP